VDEHDLQVRNHVYRRFVELGRAPSFAGARSRARARYVVVPAAQWWDDIVFT
jgi:hypothetical protein